jgi:hypothetical protein
VSNVPLYHKTTNEESVGQPDWNVQHTVAAIVAFFPLLKHKKRLPPRQSFLCSPICYIYHKYTSILNSVSKDWSNASP